LREFNDKDHFGLSHTFVASEQCIRMVRIKHDYCCLCYDVTMSNMNIKCIQYLPQHLIMPEFTFTKTLCLVHIQRPRGSGNESNYSHFLFFAL